MSLALESAAIESAFAPVSNIPKDIEYAVVHESPVGGAE